MKQSEALDALISWRGDLDEVARQLKRWPYDTSESLVTLRADHVRHVLKRYLAGAVAAEQVERWADLVEQRPGVEYAAGQEEVIADALFVLSSPDINGELTQLKAASLLRRLPGAAL
jgi:hypothetical protein